MDQADREKKRSLPSQSAAFRYLSNFHEPEQEKVRTETTKKAFIPTSNEHLSGLEKINKDFCDCLTSVHPQKTATLDMDATLVETNKRMPFGAIKGLNHISP